MILVYLSQTDRLASERVAQQIQAAAEGRRHGQGPWSAEHAAAASHAPAKRAAAARALRICPWVASRAKSVAYIWSPMPSLLCQSAPFTPHLCSGRRCNRLPGPETNTTAQYLLLDQSADPAVGKRSRKLMQLIRKNIVSCMRHLSTEELDSTMGTVRLTFPMGTVASL